MTNLAIKSIALCGALLVAANVSALDMERISTPRALPDDVKLRFRNVAIAAPSEPAPTVLDAGQPVNVEKKVRQRRARERAGGVADYMFEPIPPFIPEARAAVLTPFILIGYATGLAKTPSEEEIAQYARALAADRDRVEFGLFEAAIQEDFAKAFLGAAERQAGRRYHVGLAAGGREEADAVIESLVEKVHLKRHKRDIYSFVMEVRTRVRTADGGEIYDEALSYESGRGSLSEWACKNAEPLKGVMRRATTQLSSRLARQILPQGAASEPRRREEEKADAAGMFVIHANPLHPRELARLGNVGVISTSAWPRIAMQRPLTKEQATVEARDGLLEGFMNLPPFPSVMAASTVFLIPASVAGQTWGQVRGMSEKGLERADRALFSAGNELKLQPLLRERVLAHATNATRHPIFEVPKPFPAGEEKQFSQFATVMAGTLAWLPEGQSAEYYLRSQNAQTVLEVEVIEPALNGFGEVNPVMRFSARVKATLWRVENGMELASCELRHASPPRFFAEWAANDAALLRREFVTFTEGASAAIVQQLGMPAWGAPAPMVAAAH